MKIEYFINDTLILLGRFIKHITRSIDTLITVCLTPIGIMLLFVYVFGGAIGNGMSHAQYVQYMLPGILLMAISSAIGYSAMRLYQDVKQGFFDRFTSMPIHPSSLLWAHVLTSLVSNIISCAFIILVAVFMGFRASFHLGNWMMAFFVLLLFTLALTWIAIIAGLKAKTIEGASAFSYPLVFLPFISSAFIPTDTMPTAIRVFAQHQPVTYIVDSVRALLMNQAVGDELWIGILWCVVIMVIACSYALHCFKRTKQ